MSTMPLKLSVSGPDLLALLKISCKSLSFPELPPRVTMDDQGQPPIRNWIEAFGRTFQRDMFAWWDDDVEHFAGCHKDSVAKVATPSFPRSAERALALVETLPCEVVTFSSIHQEWSDFPDRYLAPGFGNLHFGLGWGCAFKGAGHDRLVSRRWLDFGPWRVLRGADDTTLVQFHDLALDATAARQQAAPAHVRMGISDSGGFLQRPYVYTFGIDGLYVAAERRLRVLVHGRELSSLEMLDACAVLKNQKLGPQRPLDAIAYVFADEASARAHLHELWLHELECWTFVGGKEVRIDLDYQPTPTKPAWVEALERGGA